MFQLQTNDIYDMDIMTRRTHKLGMIAAENGGGQGTFDRYMRVLLW
jgi:hypothetical protein